VAYLDAVAYTKGAFVPGGSDVLGGDGEPLEAAAALERLEMELGAGGRMLTRGRWDWVWGFFCKLTGETEGAGGWLLAKFSHLLFKPSDLDLTFQIRVSIV
jgi:hypothetical protein